MGRNSSIRGFVSFFLGGGSYVTHKPKQARRFYAHIKVAVAFLVVNFSLKWSQLDNLKLPFVLHVNRMILIANETHVLHEKSNGYR